jgi:hypothetical protein
MNVTRDVIIDLWPLYESGEASDATRRLVEAYLRQDEDLARLMRDSPDRAVATDLPPAPRPESELATLRRTKRLVWVRDALFWIAVFLTVSPLTIYDTSWGSGWVVRDHPFLAGGLASAAVVVWCGYFCMKRRLGATGL